MFRRSWGIDRERESIRSWNSSSSIATACRTGIPCPAVRESSAKIPYTEPTSRPITQITRTTTTVTQPPAMRAAASVRTAATAAFPAATTARMAVFAARTEARAACCVRLAERAAAFCARRAFCTVFCAVRIFFSGCRAARRIVRTPRFGFSRIGKPCRFPSGQRGSFLSLEKAPKGGESLPFERLDGLVA